MCFFLKPVFLLFCIASTLQVLTKKYNYPIHKEKDLKIIIKGKVSKNDKITGKVLSPFNPKMEQTVNFGEIQN